MSRGTDEEPVRHVRFLSAGALTLDSSPAHAVAADEVALRPLAVGVCGTDSHILEGTFAAEPGVVLGHEVCGQVVEVGKDVQDVAMGDLVTVEPHRYCTTCWYCRNGQEHLCEHRRGYGVRLDGGLTDRMVVPARIAYRLPPDLPPWIGALAEPLACCIHAMDRLAPRSGLPLLLIGAGPAGLLLLALAIAQGLSPIVVLEPRADRRRAALRFGADHALDPRDPCGDSVLHDVTEGRGFAYVVDAAGSASTVEQAVARAARGGTILIFGVSRPDDLALISPHELFARELSIVGALINPWTHQRAVAMLPRLGLDRLRPAFFQLDEVEAALAAQRDGISDKVFIAPAGKEAALLSRK